MTTLTATDKNNGVNIEAAEYANMLLERYNEIEDISFFLGDEDDQGITIYASDISRINDNEQSYTKAHKIMIAYGGPNAWIDLIAGEIGVQWAAGTCRRYITNPAALVVMQEFSEMLINC